MDRSENRLLTSFKGCATLMVTLKRGAEADGKSGKPGHTWRILSADPAAFVSFDFGVTKEKQTKHVNYSYNST